MLCVVVVVVSVVVLVVSVVPMVMTAVTFFMLRMAGALPRAAVVIPMRLQFMQVIGIVSVQMVVRCFDGRLTTSR